MLFQQVKHCAVIEVFKDFLVAVRVSGDVVVADEIKLSIVRRSTPRPCGAGDRYRRAGGRGASPPRG